MMLNTPEGLDNFTSEDPVPLSVEIGRYIQSSAAQCGIYTCFALICAGVALFIYITCSCPSCVYRTKKLSFCAFHYHLVFRGIAAVFVAILTFVFPKLFYTVRKRSDHEDGRVTSHLLFFGREVAFSDKKQRILLLNARRNKIDRVACCCLFTMFLLLAISVILGSLAMFSSYFPLGGYRGCRDGPVISSMEVCLQLKPNVKVINCSKVLEAGIDDTILDENVACYQVSPAIGQASGAALGVFKLMMFLLVLMVHLCKMWLDYLGEVCQCVKSKKVLPVWHSFLTGVGIFLMGGIFSLILNYYEHKSYHHFDFSTLVYKTGPGNFEIYKYIPPINITRFVLVVLIFLACLIIPCLLTYYSRQPLFTINKSHSNREDESESEESKETASNSRLLEANKMTKSGKYGGVKGEYVPIENSNCRMTGISQVQCRHELAEMDR